MRQRRGVGRSPPSLTLSLGGLALARRLGCWYETVKCKSATRPVNLYYLTIYPLLRAELPQLEAEAKRMRQNLGVDVQQPLVQLIRRLA